MTIATYNRPVSVNRAFNQAFRQLQREVDQLFVGDSSANSVASEAPASWKPAVDIHEYDDRFVLRADVPGVALADIDITIDKNLLTVSGSRSSNAGADIDTDQSNLAESGELGVEQQTVAGQAHRIERAAGQFSRQFRLPETVNIDAVKASADLGVIEITVPKAEKVQPRKIVLQPAT